MLKLLPFFILCVGLSIQYQENEICELCKFIVHIIQVELLVSNKTIVAVEKIIKDICSKLKNDNKKKECFDILNDIDIIKDYIIQGLDPQDICYEIGFCNNTTDL